MKSKQSLIWVLYATWVLFMITFILILAFANTGAIKKHHNSKPTYVDPICVYEGSFDGKHWILTIPSVANKERYYIRIRIVPGKSKKDRHATP